MAWYIDLKWITGSARWFAVAVSLLGIWLTAGLSPTLAQSDQAVNEPTDDRAGEEDVDTKIIADDQVIRGRVVDESGEAIAAARLWVQVDQDDDSQTIAATADASGEFTLHVPNVDPLDPKGAYFGHTVWGYSADHCIDALYTDDQWLEESNSPLLLRLSPKSDTGFIVQDTEGNPIEGAFVEPDYYRTNGRGTPPQPVRERTGGTTDSAGRVQLPATVRDRLLYVNIRKAGYGTQRVRLNASTSADPIRIIELRPTGRLEIQLSSDSPVDFEDYRCTVFQHFLSGKASGVARADVEADGRVTIPQIATGTTQMLLSTKNPSSTMRPRIPEEFEIRAGETTTVEIPMEKTVRVTGRVQTQPGAKPVPHAFVQVFYGTGKQSESVLTDEDGRFAVNVLPGQLHFDLPYKPRGFKQWTKEYSSWKRQFEIPADNESIALPALNMNKIVERIGLLLDSRGAPVASLLVHPIADGRRFTRVKTGRDGTFKLRVPETLKIEKYEVSEQRYGLQTTAEVVSESPLVLRLKP